MPAWDITPSGVWSVTSLVGEAIDGVEGDVTAYGKHVESAAASAGTISGAYCGEGPPTGPIAAAMGQFVQRTAEDLAFIGRRAVKSVNGAREATGAYIAGNVAMAADTQRAAVEPPVIDLSGRGGSGEQAGGDR